ncbi:hypothetical protein CDAR_543121 [Caerostris darwini]|uniref:Uncharacterized protein n=1 Tax=Caerostris darwini TaxID=1538125 RepID=A0AAV4X4F1_9ARAC|nr:hypothetical protein CDAR_543121 [Caerostris darwini]
MNELLHNAMRYTSVSDLMLVCEQDGYLSGFNYSIYVIYNGRLFCKQYRGWDRYRASSVVCVHARDARHPCISWGHPIVFIVYTSGGIKSLRWTLNLVAVFPSLTVRAAKDELKIA